MLSSQRAQQKLRATKCGLAFSLHFHTVSCLRTSVKGRDGGTGVLPGEYYARRERQGSDYMIPHAS